jgi:S1-C subfamily serine protease
MAKVVKALETLKPGDELKVTVLRDGKVQGLSMKFTGR